MKQYKRLTNQKWSEDIDLTQELGYSYIYKRLYELETKIENKTLVELPCKIGDIIYAVNSPRVVNAFGPVLPTVEEYVVTGIRMYEDEVLRRFNTQIECYPLVFGPYNYGKHTFNIDDIFLNEAEAKQRLEEVINGTEN